MLRINQITEKWNEWMIRNWVITHQKMPVSLVYTAYITSHLVNFSDVLRRDLATTKNPFDSCSALPVGDDLTCFLLLGSLHLLGDYCRSSFTKKIRALFRLKRLVDKSKKTLGRVHP